MATVENVPPEGYNKGFSVRKHILRHIQRKTGCKTQPRRALAIDVLLILGERLPCCDACGKCGAICLLRRRLRVARGVIGHTLLIYFPGNTASCSVIPADAESNSSKLPGHGQADRFSGRKTERKT